MGGTVVSFFFKGNSLHSVTEFHLISSFFLLNKCFLSLIICGIFSIASTSHADGREMQGRWLRIRRQWAVKNHAKSCIGTTVIFLLCIKKTDNFLTLFTSETEYSLNSHFPKQHYGTGWGFWLFTKIPIDTVHYFFGTCKNYVFESVAGKKVGFTNPPFPLVQVVLNFILHTTVVSLFA